MVSMTACHKLDVPVTTQLTPEVFPAELVLPVHSGCRSGLYEFRAATIRSDYHFMQSLSTDEAILPARGGNWHDNRELY